jgi:predicted O-methyltransferase YrrM
MNPPKGTRAFLDELHRVGRIVAERNDANAVPPDGGALLHALVLACGARRTLELGTGLGFSGLWIAAALRHTGGTLLTVDADHEKSAAAQHTFARVGLADVVTTRIATISETLSRLDQTFDFVFIDADKDRMMEYWNLLQPHLAATATVVTDNINTHPRQLSAFLEHVRSLPGYYSMPLDIGNGMELTIRIGWRETR